MLDVPFRVLVVVVATVFVALDTVVFVATRPPPVSVCLPEKVALG